MTQFSLRPRRKRRSNRRAGCRTIRLTHHASDPHRRPLEIVEEQVALIETTIEVQLGVLKDLRAKGYATGDADTHLTILSAKLVMQLADREKLRAEVAELPPE
jgi:hypothetical protein